MKQAVKSLAGKEVPTGAKCVFITMLRHIDYWRRLCCTILFQVYKVTWRGSIPASNTTNKNEESVPKFWLVKN